MTEQESSYIILAVSVGTSNMDKWEGFTTRIKEHTICRLAAIESMESQNMPGRN